MRRRPPAPPPGVLVITCTPPPQLVPTVAVPVLTVDGWAVPARWGTVELPVLPGPHRVAVSTRLLLETGRTTLDVVVAPGQRLPVFYAAPWHELAGGHISTQPLAADTRGLRILFTVVLVGAAVAAVVGLVLIVLGVL